MPSLPQAAISLNDRIARRVLAMQTKLGHGRLTRGVATIALGHIGGYALMLLATPILTRLYSPAQFGVLATYGSMMSLLGVAICLRYEAAIPLPKSSRGAARLAQLALLSGLLLFFPAILGVGFVLDWFGPGSRLAVLRPYLVPLALNLVAYGLFQVLTLWATRDAQFRQLAKLRFTLIVSMVTAQFVFAFLFRSWNGLILGQLAGYSMTCLITLVWLGKRNLPKFSWRGLRVAALSYRRFPQFGVASETLNISQTTVPPLLLASLYGTTCAGWFMLAWRIVGAPLTLLVVPVGRVYLSEASRIGNQAPVELRHFFLRTLRKSALVGTPVIALLAVSARVLFPWALGQQWTQAGVYCQVLCPLLLMHLFAVSIRPTFDVTHRQDLQFVAAITGASLMLLGLLVPYYYLGDPLVTIATMSATGCVAHLFSVSLSWYAIGHPRGAHR